MALIAATLAFLFSATPSRLVLGRDAGADLQVQAPLGAKVSLSSSVGTIGETKRDGGVVHARYTPPPLKVPSVALVLAQIDDGEDRELAWLSIPLSGSDTMEIETRPGASVEALLAGQTFGPVTADAKGTAKLSLVVPPGVANATLRITDKLGNVNQKPLDLDPPPFSRLRVAARAEAATAASPLELEIFVVRPDGTPDKSAKVDLLADQGDAEVVKRLAPGVYLASYLPPPGLSGTIRLEGRANGQLAAVDVQVRSPSVRIAQPFWQSALAGRKPWSVAVGVIGGGGATFDGSAAGSVMGEVSLRPEVLPLEAFFDAGGSFFSPATQSGTPVNTTERARPRTLLFQLGVRAGRQMVRGIDGHVALAFGVQHQTVTSTLSSGQPAFDTAAWTPRVAIALGANMRLGPGRALLQMQFDPSAAGIARLQGSVGGVQLLAGYLLTLR
jgi:hypothetical protein